MTVESASSSSHGTRQMSDCESKEGISPGQLINEYRRTCESRSEKNDELQSVVRTYIHTRLTLLFSCDKFTNTSSVVY